MCSFAVRRNVVGHRYSWRGTLLTPSEVLRAYKSTTEVAHGINTFPARHRTFEQKVTKFRKLRSVFRKKVTGAVAEGHSTFWVMRTDVKLRGSAGQRSRMSWKSTVMVSLPSEIKRGIAASKIHRGC